MTTQQQTTLINGIDPNEVKEMVSAIAQDARQGSLAFQVSTAWIDGQRSLSRVKAFEWAGQHYGRSYTLTIDEPEELGGTDLGPNPQEVLLAALNACIVATFVGIATLHGVQLEKVEVTSTGRLDLRGFFKLDEAIAPGYQELGWTITVKGDAAPEQLREIYQAAIAASPNLWNIVNPVNTVPELRIEA